MLYIPKNRIFAKILPDHHMVYRNILSQTSNFANTSNWKNSKAYIYFNPLNMLSELIFLLPRADEQMRKIHSESSRIYRPRVRFWYLHNNISYSILNITYAVKLVLQEGINNSLLYKLIKFKGHKGLLAPIIITRYFRTNHPNLYWRESKGQV